MAINQELRSLGVGGSEVAAVLGLDPRRDAFAVYAAKVGLLKPTAPNPRMRRGKYFERGVIDWYSDITGQPTHWFDQTVQNPQRSWQVVSPDAWVLGISPDAPPRIGGCDAKTVAFDQRESWGETGTDIVPVPVNLQCQWTLSTVDLPWWDVAALVGLDELRIYRIHRSPEVEAILLDEVETFWTKHVLARVPPPPGPSPATTEALKQMFPKHVENIRCASAEEMPLVEALRTAKCAAKVAEKALAQAENQIKLAIGDAEGLLAGAEKITWKKDADSVGPDWKAVAAALCENEARLAELAAAHQIVTRQGARKLLTPRSWTKE